MEPVLPAMAVLKYVREAQEKVGSREVLRSVEEGDEQVEWKAAVPTEEGERHASAEEVRMTRKEARREAKDRRIESAKHRVALGDEGAEHVKRVVHDLEAELERRRRAQAEEVHEKLERRAGRRRKLPKKFQC
ncbi:hypothetical protein PF006_g24115 [Phytophthora fragariae]|uniref:Uncharacterized protein n=2 Tax=Phytophthora fragariae TaxID=53985 RepID=A0A6A3REK5_9STRA|nr:hypothetical protein PF006_g24115 [Phytophthora fragariae]